MLFFNKIIAIINKTKIITNKVCRVNNELWLYTLAFLLFKELQKVLKTEISSICVIYWIFENQSVLYINLFYYIHFALKLKWQFRFPFPN